MLTQVLELIYDAGEANRNHTIIVVGEPSPQSMASVASRVKVLKWSDVEREGFKVEKIISPLPSESPNICRETVQLMRSNQSQVMCSLFHSSPPSPVTSRVLKSRTKTSLLESRLSADWFRFLMLSRNWTLLSLRIPLVRHMGEPSRTLPFSRERVSRPSKVPSFSMQMNVRRPCNNVYVDINGIYRHASTQRG
jgi:hypothetical protein